MEVCLACHITLPSAALTLEQTWRQQALPKVALIAAGLPDRPHYMLFLATLSSMTTTSSTHP